MGKAVPILLIAVFLSAILMASAHAAETADVTITIPNVESAQGTVRVFICTPDEFLGSSCAYKKAGPAKPGTMTFTIQHVPTGTYAIEVYQDENNNGKIDFGMLGLLPEEGYGFSRLSRIYSKPDFDDAAVEIEAPKTSFQIALHYP